MSQTDKTSEKDDAPFKLPDPAVLVDESGRIAGSNSAARRQMQFEMRGQFLS